MIELPDQNEDQLKNEFFAFDHANSTVLDKLPSGTYSILRCQVPQAPGSIGLWIGEPSHEFVSYLALRPVQHGALSGFEAFRAWTCPDHRRKGYARVLLKRAVRIGLIFSDRSGMTTSAFNLWSTLSEVDVKYVDIRNGEYICRSLIPKEELFTRWAQGKNWQMVLQEKGV